MIEGLGTRYESDDASPGFMLWRVTNRWQALMRRTLAPFDLTHVQFVLLAALTWSSEQRGVTQSELAQSVRVDTMMVSQVLRTLEAKGLVERRPDPDDGRARRVVATGAGVATAQAAVRAVEDADEAFFGQTSSHRQTLIEHLGALDTPR
ncbi:MarR family transcriptional regulator [Humibacter sp. BT305]|nr:MarR family transcriptional regulator [Humibacter sp. BT305]